MNIRTIMSFFSIININSQSIIKIYRRHYYTTFLNTKKEIIKQFSVAIGTLNNDLTEMRRMAQFKDGILKPSHKRVYVNPEIYEEFLRYKQMKREEAM